MDKTYLAVVSGRPRSKPGKLHTNLAITADGRVSGLVPKLLTADVRVKEAIASWELVAKSVSYFMHVPTKTEQLLAGTIS